MFKYLSKFKRLLVTGPQRSGTTICSAMIANDLNYKLILEEEFFNYTKWKFIDSIKKIKRLLKQEKVVIQAPGLSRVAHEVMLDGAVVMVIRPVEDIIASQNRIKWHSMNEVRELCKYHKTSGVISAVKYEFWEEVQKRLIKNWFEIEYDELRFHPMWDDNHKEFNARQIVCTN